MRLPLALAFLCLAACGDDSEQKTMRDTSTGTSFTDVSADVTVAPTTTSAPDVTSTPTEIREDDTQPGDVAADTAIEETAVGEDTTTMAPDAPLTVVRAPDVGDVAFSELMIDPVGRSDLSGEWLELASLTTEDTLDLATCWLDDGAGQRFDFAGQGLVRLRAGGRFVVARSEDDAAVDADLVQTVVLLPNAAGRLSFGCGTTIIDTVVWDASWPLAPGRALHVPADASANDRAENACAATAVYDVEGPNRGTPGAVDEACPPRDVTVDACALIAPTSRTLRAGDDDAFAGLAAEAWIDEAGATDLSAGIDPIPGFVAEVGLAHDASAMAWRAAEPAPDLLDATHPERDTWRAAIEPLAIGTWTVAFRVSLDRGDTWKDCGAATLTVVPSPCDPNPCSRPAEVACEGDVVTASPALGTCTVVEDVAACAWPVTRVDCTTLGGSCDAGVCIDVAGPPEPGTVIIDEIMKNPSAVDDTFGEWFELINLGDQTVQLAGCVLSDDTTDHIVLAAPSDDAGALTLAPGGLVTLAAERDRGRNGGIDAAIGWNALGAFTLDNGNDAILLTCDGVLIDVVRYTSSFPNNAGRAMQLSPRKYDATWNDLASSWCLSQTATGGGTFPDYGTPGELNPPCPEAVERCRLVAPPELQVVGGQSFTVAIQLRHVGITDRTAGVDRDPLVLVEGGLAPPGYYPTWGSWEYTAAVPDGAWSDATVPREDQWLATLVADASYDTRDVAGRVSIDGGLSWVSCDRDSGLPGADGSQDGYTPQNATRLVIVPSDPCRPNPCTTPPADRCDPNGLVVYPALGVCTVVGEDAACAYGSDRFDCDALDGTCDAALGQCLDTISRPAAGELVITEVMVSPRMVSDFFGEWVELESRASEAKNLDGCVLADTDGGVTLAVAGHALVVEAGERFVIARQPANNGGVGARWTWGGSLGLGNIGDKLELRCDGQVVDAIAWDPNYPFAAGVAMQLSADAIDVDLNDVVDAWCAATVPYGAGDLGTPGAVNDVCF